MQKKISITIASVAGMSNEEIGTFVRERIRVATLPLIKKPYIPSTGIVYDYLIYIERHNWYGKRMIRLLNTGGIPAYVENLGKKPLLSDREKTALRKYNLMISNCRAYLERQKEWGRIKSKMEKVVVGKHGETCFYCLVAPYECIDHRLPLVRGGDSRLENLVPACRTCNAKKHDLTENEFLASGRI